MTTESVSYDEWWSEFVEGLRERGDAYEAAARLRRRLQALPPKERGPRAAAALHSLLVEQRAFGVALFLLEGLTDRRLLRTIASALEPLPDRCWDEEESYLADLIRLLAAADDELLVAPVRSYLLERRIDPQWSTVPWALWPHGRELFARAWRRFFVETEPAEWAGSLVVRPFLSEADAIVLVRDRLGDAAPARWNGFRDALARQAGLAGWLTTKQRTALERALG